MGYAVIVKKEMKKFLKSEPILVKFNYLVYIFFIEFYRQHV